MNTLLFPIMDLASLFSSGTTVNAAPPQDVSIPVAYSVPAEGFLSLALSNEEGQLVRSLL